MDSGRLSDGLGRSLGIKDKVIEDWDRNPREKFLATLEGQTCQGDENPSCFASRQPGEELKKRDQTHKI